MLGWNGVVFVCEKGTIYEQNGQSEIRVGWLRQAAKTGRERVTRYCT